jgi:hypothetical protein
MGLGNVDFSRVIDVEFSPSSWIEFTQICFHLSLTNLLSDEKNFSTCLLAAILIEDFLSGSLTSSIGNWHCIVIEDIVHNIILIGTIVTRCWCISSGWWWVTLSGHSDSF